MTERILPVHLDVEVAAHADHDQVWTLTDADGDVVNIAAETVALTVYRRQSDATPFIEKVNEPGEHTDPTNGVTTFTFTPDDSEWLTTREQLLYYEIWRIYESGTKRFPWFAGGMLFVGNRGVDI